MISSNGSLKLIDFGAAFAKSRNSELMETLTGSTYYLSPDVLSGSYTESVDLWSIGVLIYELVTETFPFKGDT